MRPSSFTKTDTLKAKAIAVILMLFHHLFGRDLFIQRHGIAIPFLRQDQLISLGVDARVCVWIFVFLSAYGISIKLLKNRKGESTVKILYTQWWSLMKPFWFVFITMFFVSFLFPQSASCYEFHEGKWHHILMDFLGWSEFTGTGLWMSSWWYMCFAQVLLITLPLLVLLVEKMGVFSLPLTYLMILFNGPNFKFKGGYFSVYLYAILLAILFVKYDLFERLGKKPKGVLQIMEALGLLLAFWLFARLKVSLTGTAFSDFAPMSSALSVVALCLLVKKYLTASWLEKVLSFIGKHSGNIYLIHVALYVNLPELIFSTKTVFGSVMILLGVCLFISIILESLKKLLRYDKLVNILSTKLLNWFSLSPAIME